jgi:uncharacterized membrane-anchored protein YitT (DUF2179 family)
MSAFNRRLQPKEVFGMPLVAALGLTVALICFVLSLLVPLALKFFTIPLTLAGAIVAGLAFYMGDDLQFLNVMRLGRFVENNRVTSETRTKD